MNGPGARDSVSKDGQARRRLTGFVLASLGLHAILLIAVQLVAQRRPVTVAPEPLPVQFVELDRPTAAPEPDIPPDIPEELPTPPPEIPQESAETPDIPPPQPTPVPEPDFGAATTPAPQPEPEDENAALILPDFYRGEPDSRLARFGLVLECATLDMRYTDYCADVGPVYLTQQDVESLLPQTRFAPEIEQAWRELDEALAAAQKVRSSGDMDAVVPCALMSVCIPPPERFEARRQGVRAGLRELGVID